MSCTCSTYARLAAPISRSERGAPRRAGAGRPTSVSFVAGTSGTSTPKRRLRCSHDLRLEEADDRLAERHRLEREDAVPAGVELVDDDVGARVALARLVVRERLRRCRGRPAAARRPRSRAPSPCGGGSTARARRAAARGRDGGTGVNALVGRWPAGPPSRRAPSESRRTSRRSARRRACRRRARPASCRGCRSRGSGRPTSCASARRIGNCTILGTSVSPK